MRLQDRFETFIPAEGKIRQLKMGEVQEDPYPWTIEIGYNLGNNIYRTVLEYTKVDTWLEDFVYLSLVKKNGN